MGVWWFLQSFAIINCASVNRRVHVSLYVLPLSLWNRFLGQRVKALLYIAKNHSKGVVPSCMLTSNACESLFLHSHAEYVVKPWILAYLIRGNGILM